MAPTGSQRARVESIDLDSLKSTPSTIFAAPGLKPDVFLNVLEEEYHVHSAILKLYSNYFRKTLNGPNKQKGSSTGFKYRCTSVVAENRAWELESAAKVSLVLNMRL